jgi:4-amino-4-deoxy-L-arabinose transferase-like glycosyltransferase
VASVEVVSTAGLTAGLTTGATTGATLSAANARARLALLAVVAVYLGLGFLYSVRNPLFESPDENWHFEVVRYIAAGNGLPSLLPESRRPELGGEAGQPPLYYVLAGALTSWIPPDDLSRYIESNPSGSRGYPETDGNKNVWVQLQPDRFPWHGEYLAAHLARLLSLLFGALAVVATYATARELFPSRPARWPTSAAIAALVPKLLFVTAAVTNDSAATAAGAATVYVVARIVGREPSRRLDVLLGAVLGLAVLSKLSLLMAVPFAGGALALVCWQRGERFKGLVCRALRVGAPLLIVAGWWYLRNWLLYRDPTGLSPFLEAVGTHEIHMAPIGEVVADLPGLWASFWGVFGWFSVPVEPGVYLWYGALTVVAVVGIGRYAWINRRERSSIGRVGLLAFWLLLVFGALVRWRMILLGFDGRLLFPAISAIAILLALGLLAIGPRVVATVLTAGFVAGMLAIATVTPGRYIAAAYAPRPMLTAAELSAAPTQTRLVYGDAIELLGYSPAQPRVGPDGQARIDFYWRAVAPMALNYSLSVQAFDESGKLLARDESYPGRGTLPTSRWRVGDAVRESRVLTFKDQSNDQSEMASAAKLVVAVHKPDVVSLEARDASGAALGVSPVVGRVGVGRPTLSEAASAPDRVLGGRVALIDHAVGQQVRAGEVLSGKLTWQSLARTETDLTVFVQLIGPVGGSNGLAAQYDAQPRRGAYPTTWWSVGEVVSDEFEIALKDVRPGDYRLIAGMYDLASGKRLAGAGADYLDLGIVRITP